MNQKGFSNIVIGIIVVVLLIVVGGYFLLEQKSEVLPSPIPTIQKPQTTDGVNIYTNKRLEYSLAIPNGYRLSSDYTRFMNTAGPHQIEDYTDKNAEYVLITTASNSDEDNFLNEMKQAAAEEEFFFVPQTFLAQSSLKQSIEIYPISVSLEQIKELAAKSLERGRNASSDFSDIMLQGGINATRYTERNPTDSEVLDVVYIPIQEEYLLRGGDKIDGITIKMNRRGDIFDNNAFESIVKSFKLLQ